MSATTLTLLNTPPALLILRDAATLLRSRAEDARASGLAEMLQIISSNAEAFDKNCQVNVEWIGKQTIERIKDLGLNPVKDEIDMVTAMIYRFMVEYDLSVKNDLSMEIRSFMNRVREEFNSLTDAAKTQVEYARQEMPISIIKKIINTDEFVNLKNVASISNTVEQKIKDWEVSLHAKEEKASRLGEALEKHTQAFNFVGLHKGFADLAKDIKVELRFAQAGIAIFGLLVLVPSSLDLWFLLSRGFDVSTLKPQTLIAMALAIVAITLLFLYFFRIALRKANSCRAQLIQVRLRMSLCRFIQSYADYSSEIKSKNGDALAKFENLIFSGIVSSDEKLPSTFDGIEQITALAKSISGK